MSKAKIATVWLDGCSGCHMSFLDMDERLLLLAEKVEIVYSPIVDAKVFPEMVDVTLVEGAVSNEDDLEKVRKIRAHSRLVVSLGDCAVTSNVAGMRNPIGAMPTLERAFIENALIDKQIPRTDIPLLCEKARPVHDVIKVDVFVPGCPPSADTIFFVVSELLEGRIPELHQLTRFGA